MFLFFVWTNLDRLVPWKPKRQCCNSFSVVKSCFNCLPLYQIDLQKMPLGKLSKRQIQSAYSILNEVQQVSVMEVFQQVGSLVVVGLEWCEWWAVCVCWRFVLFLHNLRDNRKRVRTSILQGSGGSFFAEMKFEPRSGREVEVGGTALSTWLLLLFSTQLKGECSLIWTRGEEKRSGAGICQEGAGKQRAV